MCIPRLPLEILTEIVRQVPGVDGGQWLHQEGPRQDVLALRLVNRTFNYIVTPLAYGRVSLKDAHRNALQCMSYEGFAMVLREQEKNPQCINTLTTLIRRVRARAAELAQAVQNEGMDMPALACRYPNAFTVAVVPYLGKRISVEHFLSSSMPHEVALRGAKLSDDDLVALTAVWLGEKAILCHYLKENEPSESFFFVAAYFVAWTGNLDMICFLKQHGNLRNLYLSVQNDFYGEILGAAAKNGHLEVVKTLLTDFPTDINAVSDSFGTPLHAAASAGHVDVMQILLDYKADINNSVSAYHLSPLGEAAAREHCNSLTSTKLLVENGADLDALDADGGTPLLSLARRRNPCAHSVRFLLEAGANPNVMDGQGMSPLLWVIRNSRMEMVEDLLNQGAYPDRRVYKSLIKLGDNAMFDLLRNRGFRTPDLEGTHIRSVGPGKDRVALVKRLIELRADFFPARMEPGSDIPEILELLLDCTYMHKEYLHLTVFGIASRAGCNTVLEKLLDRGTTIPPDLGWAPLFPAISGGQEETIRLLIRAGTPGDKGKLLRSIWDTKRKYLSQDIIKLLFDTYIREYRFLISVDGLKNVPGILLLAIKVGSRANRTEEAWATVRSINPFYADLTKFFVDQSPKVTIADVHPNVVMKSMADTPHLGDPGLIKLFLDCFNNRDIDFPRVIKMMTLDGDLPALQCLLDRFSNCEPDLKAWNNAINSFVVKAVVCGRPYQFVELFLQHQREPTAFRTFLAEDANERDGSAISQLALRAIRRRSEHVFRLLLVHGLLAELPDRYLPQCFVEAAERNNVLVLRALLDRTTDPDARHANCRKALEANVKWRSRAAVKLLRTMVGGASAESQGPW